jgi:hypothetical protein
MRILQKYLCILFIKYVYEFISMHVLIIITCIVVNIDIICD